MANSIIKWICYHLPLLMVPLHTPAEEHLETRVVCEGKLSQVADAKHNLYFFPIFERGLDFLLCFFSLLPLLAGNILISLNLLSLKPSVHRYPNIISSTYMVNNKRCVSPISFQPCFVFSLSPSNPLHSLSEFSLSHSARVMLSDHHRVFPHSVPPHAPPSYTACDLQNTFQTNGPEDSDFQQGPPDCNAFEGSGCLCCKQL